MNKVPINIQSIHNDTRLLFSHSYTQLSYTNLHTIINDLGINFSYRKSGLPIPYEKTTLQILKFPITANLIYYKKKQCHKIRIYHRYQEVMER